MSARVPWQTLSEFVGVEFEGARFHVNVEIAPAGWSWGVSGADDGVMLVHGVAATREAAKRAAIRAVRLGWWKMQLARGVKAAPEAKGG